MNKVDIHLHLSLEPASDIGQMRISDGKAMLPHLKELFIDRGVLMSSGEGSSIRCGNEECAALSRRYPSVYSWMCCLNDENPETVEDRLFRLKAQGAVGVGELMINRPFTDPFLRKVFACAQELELPVLFHLSPEKGFGYGVVDQPGLPLLEKTLQDFPKLVLIGHSQPFWHEVSADPGESNEQRNSWGVGPVKKGGRLEELFLTYPNLYGDLSANSGGCAMMRDPEYGLSFLERFKDKLMFGTDMVNETMSFPLGAWLDQKYNTGALSKVAYERIIRRNAEALLKIET